MGEQDGDARPQKERSDTDAHLLAERTKTDRELAKNRSAVDKAADKVMLAAQTLAEETLQTARKRADSGSFAVAKGGASAPSTEVARQREAEDGAIVEERAVAAQLLLTERRDRQNALAALLRLEREATDDGLQVERARADEVVAARDNFLAMVSHDLRNMLGGIALSAAMLTKPAENGPEGELQAATIRHAARIQRFTARMNRLVGDLVDVVSLEAGKLQVNPGPVDIAQLVKEATDTFQLSFAAKRVNLSAATTTTTAWLDADHDRILQVLANLLSNALKFTAAGGMVRLTAQTAGADVCFSVVDDGVGIPADQTGAIFERFRQINPGEGIGLGLGLYIAKCIIEAHGGTIWAEGGNGAGAAIRFTLPAAPRPTSWESNAGESGTSSC